jgi:hypothetical protein
MGRKRTGKWRVKDRYASSSRETANCYEVWLSGKGEAATGRNIAMEGWSSRHAGECDPKTGAPRTTGDQ